MSAQNKTADRRINAFFYVLLAAMTFFLTGCQLNPAGSGTETTNRRTSIIGKWEFTDPDTRFASVELADNGIYIVVENEGGPLSKVNANTVNGVSFFGKAAPLLKAKAIQTTAGLSKFYTGEYTVSGSKVILTGFGMLEIDLSIDETSAVIRLQLYDTIKDSPSNIPYIPYEFNVGRAAEIASSKNTDLICRQWKFVRFLLNGELWEPWENPELWEVLWKFPEAKPEITNLFSKAGTYLQTSIVDGAEPITGLGQWRWVDDNQNSFYHTDWQTGEWLENIVNVVVLTETTLAISELFSNGDILVTEFELLR